MCRFTINLRSCIKRVTRRDDSQSSDVWSREETRSLSSDAQQDEEYKASKGHTRIRRRWSDKCVVVVKEKETPPTTDIMGEVVTTLPKALQEKGRQLVSRLKTTQWNDRGELLHEGVVVPGSNVVDLVHDLLRKRKTSDPIGWQQFGSQMRAANIPMELVGNVARRRHIQQRKRTLTPKQKKGRRVQLPDDWESY